MVLTSHAETGLDEAFEHYENARAGLGDEFLTEFRRGVDRILQYPRGWQALDAHFRRYRLNRFPYGDHLQDQRSIGRDRCRRGGSFESAT